LARSRHRQPAFVGERGDPPEGLSAVGAGCTSLRSSQRSPSGLRPGCRTVGGRAARIRGWRRSSRPSHCRSSRPPSPSRGGPRPPGSGLRSRPRCTDSPGQRNIDSNEPDQTGHGPSGGRTALWMDERRYPTMRPEPGVRQDWFATRRGPNATGV
jgi:hypothetical protein